MQPEEEWFTYRGAARRVGRSVRTIKQWRREGMPMQHDQDGRRIVNRTDLLAEYRRRLRNWPIHQQRRVAALGQGSQPPRLDTIPSDPPNV